jgi:LysM repeat protein
MRKATFTFVFVCMVLLSFSQTPELYVKNDDKVLYIEHKVTPKENFYSVGRLYNAPPKEIAALNNLDMSKGLSLGQFIRIPLTNGNFSQTDKAGTPVYYKVGEKEDLSRISKMFKISVEQLRSWNKLKNNDNDFGAKLIVGFLHSTEMPQILTMEKRETLAQKEQVAITNDLSKQEMKESKIKATISEQGFFKSYFDKQAKTSSSSKTETVASGIFKTTSGWNDGKYYLLINGVAPGTIVKVLNPVNNKIIYAKVLGEMSGIRQNEGLNIRISNAGASVLQIPDPERFTLKVNY